MTDFAQDVQIGLLGVVPLNDPLDILSIKYACQNPGTGPLLVVTMKVSDLSTVPQVSNWRMSFAANAIELTAGRLVISEEETGMHSYNPVGYLISSSKKTEDVETGRAKLAQDARRAKISEALRRRIDYA